MWNGMSNGTNIFCLFFFSAILFKQVISPVYKDKGSFHPSDPVYPLITLLFFCFSFLNLLLSPSFYVSLGFIFSINLSKKLFDEFCEEQ
jgi:hypothetical protein